MGCDIHEYYEVQQADGSWRLFNYREKYRDGNYEDGEPKYDYDDMVNDPLYLGRNYRFFAFLANVRNGRGFAGCDTGDQITPISEPRGVPEDASEYYQEAVEAWADDGHSHSWLTAEELLNADWDQTCVDRCVISFDDYQKFKETNSCHGMVTSSGVWGGDAVTVTSDEADEMLTNPDKFGDGTMYYVQVEYATPLSERLAYYKTTWLPALLELDSNPAKIRFVFFFDN